MRSYLDWCLFFSVSLICITAVNSFAEEAKAVKDPIADYAAEVEYGADPNSASDAEDLKAARLIRIIYDFNCDGIKDVAVSDSFGGAWGHGAGEWKIYIGRKDGTYLPLKDTLFFNPYAINIRQIKKGVSKITIYERLGAGEGSLTEYQMEGSNLKPLKSKTFKIEDDLAGNKEYKRLFLEPKSNPFPEFCMLQDYLKNDNKCRWKKGY